jgi:hypothetical protein
MLPTIQRLYGSDLCRDTSEIQNVGEDLYSVQVFSATFWEQFDPTASFDKWVELKFRC